MIVTLPSFPTLALSLFLMAVNIKTPVVVENITLMCLRILQKLIKPPAPTSKKNKVLSRVSRSPLSHPGQHCAPCLTLTPLTWGRGTSSLPFPQFSKKGWSFWEERFLKESQEKNKHDENTKA